MTNDWPKDELATSDERTTLLGFLEHQRRFLARKAEGIAEEQARSATCPPSDLTMHGLIRHLSDVERGWAQRTFAGQKAVPLYYGESHPDGDEDGDFHPPSDATLADALDVWRREIETANSIYNAAVDLDQIDKGRGFYSLRWILVHLIEEYARHLGHADLIRQAIDGQTGE